MGSGHRGYIASRPVRGQSTPQRVQNLVIRDYAARRGLTYLLSSAEYAMPGSTMMLENVLAELPRIDGIIMFSAFMLPAERERRIEVYERVLGCGGTLHAALENLAVVRRSEIDAFEDLISAALVLERAPLRGRYPKTERALIDDANDPFVCALLPAIIEAP